MGNREGIVPVFGAIEAMSWSDCFLIVTGSIGAVEFFLPEPHGLISPLAVIKMSKTVSPSAMKERG